MSRTKAASSIVALARIGKPHGVQGWVRLNSFTSPPENLLQYNEFHVQLKGSLLRLELDESRQQAGKLIGHFRGYDTPEAVRQLTGLDLQVEASALPALPEGEYYWHQLQGLNVVNLDKVRFGKVVRILETGANDVLVVRADADSIDTRERLIPYLSGDVVRQVDLESGEIVVDWQADYLA